MTNNIEPNAVYTTKEAAKLLKVSKSFLDRDRGEKQRIPFVKMGGVIRYRGRDLIAYLDSL